MKSRNITQYKKKDPVTGDWLIPIERDCLKCEKKFMSYSGYRRCSDCLRSDANRHGATEYKVDII